MNQLFHPITYRIILLLLTAIVTRHGQEIAQRHLLFRRHVGLVGGCDRVLGRVLLACLLVCLSACLACLSRCGILLTRCISDPPSMHHLFFSSIVLRAASLSTSFKTSKNASGVRNDDCHAAAARPFAPCDRVHATAYDMPG